jgi:hypothetical protein
MNPFVVTHNGEKYVFTPGETVEVSDGVALEIEEYKRWREKYYGTIDPPYEGGGEIEALTVSENGTYTPPEGVDGYAPVTVNVVPPASDIDALIDGSLTEITSNVESVRENAFKSCSQLTSANFPNVITIGKTAFQDCDALKTINCPNATSFGTSAFLNCTALTSANCPNVRSIEQCFMNCKSLLEITLPYVTKLNFQEFYNCYKLTKADFKSLTSILASAFYYCASLTTLMLRGETVCNLANISAFERCYHLHGTVNSTYNPDGLKDGYIYVPRALIEDYKVATNWVTFADQFRALEDYTVDGTTTGELDESKVSL